MLRTPTSDPQDRFRYALHREGERRPISVVFRARSLSQASRSAWRQPGVIKAVYEGIERTEGPTLDLTLDPEAVLPAYAPS